MLTVALHLFLFKLSVFTTPIYDFFVHVCCAWTFIIIIIIIIIIQDLP
jgi:hypothetical protein